MPLTLLDLILSWIYRKTLNHLGGTSSAALRRKMPIFELNLPIAIIKQGKKEFSKSNAFYSNESAGGQTDGH